MPASLATSAMRSEAIGTLDQQTLRFPCLMKEDPLGIPCGPAYPVFLRAAYDNTRGTAWVAHCAKSGTSLHALSTLERAAFYEAIIDPSVIDARPQYPMVDAKRLAKYLADPSLRIPRSLVPTMDLVLTRLDRSASPPIRFEAVSIKYLEELANPAVQRRIDRDQVFCQRVGWHWKLFTELEYSEQRLESSRRIAQRTVDLSLESIRPDALSAATRITKFADGRTLGEVAAALARAKSVSRNRAMDLIAAAVMHGFIAVDLNKPYDLDMPLVLIAGLPE